MKHPNEERTIATIMAMGAESLNPEMYPQLETIIAQLCETRNMDQEILQAEYDLQAQYRRLSERREETTLNQLTRST